MGISPTDKQPVFLYTGGATLSIHLNGASQTIPLNG
jgi:23S rRNA G2069 N7-methylase RlmK/C1962 C5-methylase RlmI